MFVGEPDKFDVERHSHVSSFSVTCRDLHDPAELDAES